MTRRHCPAASPPLFPSAVVVIGLASAAAFWSLIGWDIDRTVGPDGGLEGPLQPWQGWGFVATAVLIAVVSGAAGRGRELVAAMTATLTLSGWVWVRLYAGPGLGGQGGVGVMMTCAGTLAGTSVIAALAARRRDRRWVWVAPPCWPVPPDGWRPVPGWRPDAAWPPAPPQHVFWRRARHLG
jgi:hypothetical protein